MRDLIISIFGEWAGVAPTVAYCETATGGFIGRPGYAVSNIPYIFLGIYLLIWKRDQKLAKEFGIISIAVGTASFIYDASFTFLAQTVDLAAMFTFVALLVGLNIQRIVGFSRKHRWSLMFILTAIYTPLTVLWEGSSGRIIFGLAVVTTIITEAYLSRRTENYKGQKFLIALILFVVGFGIWLFDANQIICDPTNLFNGRAIYHYLTTFTIYFLWRHYSEIESIATINLRIGTASRV